MKKINIIESIAETQDISKKSATEMVDAVLDTIREGIINEDEVNLYGLFTISKVAKEATTGRNPKTGEEIDIPAKNVLKCKFSGTLKTAINE